MMEWVRGATVGRGSFATVSLAVVQDRGDSQLPKLMAVKSAPLFQSSFLQREEAILARLQHCPYIIRCFGHDLAGFDDSDEQYYNLFLEYASGGTLSDLVRRFGGSFPEPIVRRFTRSLLEGLRSMHAEGYVHCDIKLQNILVRSDGDVRIADFGLAKKIGDKADDCTSLRGTPIYMSPESVARNEYQALADIWSLGCVVAETASGRPAWRFSGDGNVWDLLLRIGFGDETPEIPAELSDVGKDFLRRCFAKDPEKRWTAEMLLGHPFVADSRSFDDDADAVMLPFVSGTARAECCTLARPSPSSILEFSQWVSPTSHSPSTCSDASLDILTPSPDCCHASPTERISDLATGQRRPDWSCFSSVGSWIDVRQVGFVSKPEDSYRSRDEQQSAIQS